MRKSLESKARKQMEKTMLEMARNPDALKYQILKRPNLTIHCVSYHVKCVVKICLEDMMFLNISITI